MEEKSADYDDEMSTLNDSHEIVVSEPRGYMGIANNSRHQENPQQIQQEPRQRELYYDDQVDSNAMVFRPDVTRESHPDSQRRVLVGVVSGRDRPAQQENVRDAPWIEQPNQLMINGGAEHNNENDLVVYDMNNNNSGRKDNERPTKRSRLDSDTALMAEVSMAARDLPQSYEEAISVIKREFEAHERNKTWSPVKHQPDMKTVGCKWVLAKGLMDDTKRD